MMVHLLPHEIEDKGLEIVRKLRSWFNSFKDFRNNVKPNWCPGMWRFLCTSGHAKAAANVVWNPEVAIITGIGCSGRLSGYINSYGVHAIHGRAYL